MTKRPIQYDQRPVRTRNLRASVSFDYPAPPIDWHMVAGVFVFTFVFVATLWS